MAQPPPPFFVPSAGAPPGTSPYYLPSAAAVPGTLGSGIGRAPKAWESLSTLAIVLACGQLLWFLYGLVVGLITLVTGNLLSGAFGSAGGAGAPIDDIRRFTQLLTMLEMARGVPFAICSIVLLVIAFGVRRGRVESLRSARTWPWFALGVVALSLAFQLLVTAPMSAAYQRSFFGKMGAGAAGSGGLDTFQIYAQLVAIVMPIFWSAVMCVWPIVLRLWADRLLRAMPDDPSAPAATQ